MTPLDEQALALCRKGHNIDAMRLVATERQCTLRDAKAHVEALIAQHIGDQRDYLRRQRRAGLL